MELTRCPETSVENYHSTLHIIPKELRSIRRTCSSLSFICDILRFLQRLCWRLRYPGIWRRVDYCQLFGWSRSVHLHVGPRSPRRAAFWTILQIEAASASKTLDSCITTYTASHPRRPQRLIFVCWHDSLPPICSPAIPTQTELYFIDLWFFLRGCLNISECMASNVDNFWIMS
jgi:hypothetical protein